jgi:hypothetical protein
MHSRNGREENNLRMNFSPHFSAQPHVYSTFPRSNTVPVREASIETSSSFRAHKETKRTSYLFVRVHPSNQAIKQSIYSTMGWFTYQLCALALLISHQVSMAVAQEAGACFGNSEFNDFYATDEPTCCQNDVCAIPCPEPIPKPTPGFGIGIIVAIVISFVIGFATLFLVQGEAENFFVAGRSLPLWIVSMTLGAQSIDSNAILGNADLSYKYHL